MEDARRERQPETRLLEAFVSITFHLSPFTFYA
jgi:hypothetical protein